jgi:hypothetical protein
MLIDNSREYIKVRQLDPINLKICVYSSQQQHSSAQSISSSRTSEQHHDRFVQCEPLPSLLLLAVTVA